MFEWADVMIFGFITLVLQISVIRSIVLRLPRLGKYVGMEAQTMNTGAVFRTFKMAGILVIPVFSLIVFALMLYFMDEIKKNTGLK
jgi:hypothetical protein